MPKKVTKPKIYNWTQHTLDQYHVPEASRDVARKNFQASWEEAMEYYDDRKYAPAMTRFHQAFNAVNTISDAEKNSEDHYIHYHCLVMMSECLLAGKDYASACIYLQAAAREIEFIEDAQTSRLIGYENIFMRQAAKGYIFAKLAGAANQVGRFQDASLYYQLAVIADEALLLLKAADKNSAYRQLSQHLNDYAENDMIMKRYVDASKHALASADALLQIPAYERDQRVRDLLANSYFHAGEGFLLNKEYKDAIHCFKQAEKIYSALVTKSHEKKHLDKTAEINERIAYAETKLEQFQVASASYKQAEDQISHLKSKINGKRYRYDGRARLNESKAAVREMSKSQGAETLLPDLPIDKVPATVEEQPPKQPPKKSFFHFMRFFTKKAESLPEVPKHNYNVRMRTP